jgi:hypothetical protein
VLIASGRLVFFQALFLDRRIFFSCISSLRSFRSATSVAFQSRTGGFPTRAWILGARTLPSLIHCWMVARVTPTFLAAADVVYDSELTGRSYNVTPTRVKYKV